MIAALAYYRWMRIKDLSVHFAGRISYSIKLGYCFSTHFDNFVFCALIPFDVVGLVGMSFKNDKCPAGVVTEIE